MQIDFNALGAFITALVAALISILSFLKSSRHDAITLLQAEVARLHKRIEEMEIEHAHEREEWMCEREKLWAKIREQSEQIESLIAERARLRYRVEELEQQMHIHKETSSS